MKWNHTGDVSWAQLAEFYRIMGWQLKGSFPNESDLKRLATSMAEGIDRKVGSRSICGRLRVTCDRSWEFGRVVYRVEAEGPLQFNGFSDSVRGIYKKG
ncbi:MAG: hypothetical protein OEM51_01730 [Gammaproteobacteria bacterium]|nr:hypothetical protein [Gammaproteobacteria bacterium]